jgi:hypothetical protein
MLRATKRTRIEELPPKMHSATPPVAGSLIRGGGKPSNLIGKRRRDDHSSDARLAFMQPPLFFAMHEAVLKSTFHAATLVAEVAAYSLRTRTPTATINLAASLETLSVMTKSPLTRWSSNEAKGFTHLGASCAALYVCGLLCGTRRRQSSRKLTATLGAARILPQGSTLSRPPRKEGSAFNAR